MSVRIFKTDLTFGDKYVEDKIKRDLQKRDAVAFAIGGVVTWIILFVCFLVQTFLTSL